jgi:transcriptional regulator with XRE-family HTH domain
MYFTGSNESGNVVLTLLIKQFRLQKGLSQRELAILARVPKSTLGEIENHMMVPRLDVLERIAEALGVTIDELYKK